MNVNINIVTTQFNELGEENVIKSIEYKDKCIIKSIFDHYA